MNEYFKKRKEKIIVTKLNYKINKFSYLCLIKKKLQ